MIANLSSGYPGGIQTDRSTFEDEIPLFEADGHIRPINALEADIIRLAVRLYSGQMSEVARRLGIGRSTLYRKLGGLGIDRTL